MNALIAMSGGVDSSVAAFLMQQRGASCTGCTMRLYENDLIGADLFDSCCSAESTGDAREICARLGIPHVVFHYENAFLEEVVEPFVCSYERGETPNPCIDCNRCMKFSRLMEQAHELDCDTVVTGHYARIVRRSSDGRPLLKKAADPAKDQSYVLYQLTEEQLSHIVFPLGEMTKEEVRGIAEAQGFVNARKHDSQDICFVPDGDYGAMLCRYRGRTYPPGSIEDEEGHVLGMHRGIVHYTIGQRRGLGIPSAGRLYVKELDTERNAVILAEDAALWHREVRLRDFHWITGDAPAAPFRCQVKIRYRHREQPAVVTPLPEGGAEVLFDEPQRAPTPGQAAVFYDMESVLGGGVISGFGFRKDSSHGINASR